MNDTIPQKPSPRVLPFIPIAFAVAGALSRFEFQWIETRIQIIWFWVATLWVQFFLLSASRSRVGTSLFLLNGAAATFAILLTKFALEGFPHYAGKALVGLF